MLTNSVRVGFAAIATLLVALSGCSKPEQAAERVVNVTLATVSRQSIAKIIRCEAVLFPLQQAAVTSKVSAPVKRFYVNRGSRVQAGQLLATLESKDLAASANENGGALVQAQAEYTATLATRVPEEMRKAELDVEATKQAFEAEQKSFQNRQNLYQQGALPRKDLDQARVSLVQAKSQYEIAQQHWNAAQAGGREQELKSASGQLQTAEGKYQGAQAQLSYAKIRSPIRGIVTDRALNSGEMATAGTPLLVVMETSSVIAKAHIPAEDAALLRTGSPAEITVPGSEDKIPARITVVSPATDPNSTTIEVWAQAANPDDILRPGTTVQLLITAENVDNALVVPASAVLKQPDGSSAVMLTGSDNRARLQAVQLGIENGSDIQVTAGLKAGQQVVSNGAYGLPDNTRITVDTSAAANPKSD